MAEISGKVERFPHGTDFIGGCSSFEAATAKRKSHVVEIATASLPGKEVAEPTNYLLSSARFERFLAVQ